MPDERTPRTFREVGMLFARVLEKIEEIEETQEKIMARMDRLISVFVVSILCPIIVSVACSFIINNSK